MDFTTRECTIFPENVPSDFKRVLAEFPALRRGKLRLLQGQRYNYVFNYDNGTFVRWGNTLEDDPPFSPIGPEIVDLEISTVCHGVAGVPCKFCYKENTPAGENMTFDAFKQIFSKLPANVMQIAFGIGDIDGNPDMARILRHCRANPRRLVIPNITINGSRLTDSLVALLASTCGAVAVSHYDDDTCFDAVHRLAKCGMKQVNIHQLLASETTNDAFDLVDHAMNDPRLENLHAIVFLSLKQKGRGTGFAPMSRDSFSTLIQLALAKHVPVGFDSCSALKVFNEFKNHASLETFKALVEPCESTLFSAYINVHGDFFPCSFVEDEQGHEAGLIVAECTDFMQDIWYHPSTVKFRENLLRSAENNDIKCRNCPLFEI